MIDDTMIQTGQKVDDNIIIILWGFNYPNLKDYGASTYLINDDDVFLTTLDSQKMGMV